MFTVFPLLAHTYLISSSGLSLGQSLLHMHFGTLVLFFWGLRITWHSLGDSHFISLQGLQSPSQIIVRASIRFSHPKLSKWHWDGYSWPLDPILKSIVHNHIYYKYILTIYLKKTSFLFAFKYLPQTSESCDSLVETQVSGQWQLAELPSKEALQWA